MDTHTKDQADGLRRLFHATPPEMLAVLSCGSVTTPWLAQQLQARARAGAHVLVLDEWQACGNLANCLGVSPRFDLLHVVHEQIKVGDAVLEVMPGLRLAPVGRLAQSLGDDRVIRQRTLSVLQSLQISCDESVLLAQAGEMQGASPFLLAAPRLLLVVDAQPRSVTAAWASLKRIGAMAPEMVFALCQAGEPDARSAATLDSFALMAANKLGLQVERVAGLSEAMQLGQRAGRVPAGSYLQALLEPRAHGGTPQRDGRFSGIAASIRRALP